MFEGKCHGIVESTGKTREGNIGKAALYALVREAGGVVIALDGQDLGAKDFLTFGQLEAKGVIAARSPEVAETLRQKLVA
jgi:fructose-1,6-bisphosphatase/inositol monophosphatase family enzyme